MIFRTAFALSFAFVAFGAVVPPVSTGNGFALDAANKEGHAFIFSKPACLNDSGSGDRCGRVIAYAAPSRS